LSDWVPRRAKVSGGRFRRVGVEIEFGDLPVARAADAVRSAFGGTAREVSDYERHVEGTAVGDFVVELDFALLKRLGKERAVAPQEPSWWERLPEDLLAAFSDMVVPVEIAAPPIPVPGLGRLEKLVHALREAGARGTDALPQYAFGVHFNVELPSLEIEGILAYARAFLVLEQALREDTEVDATRSMLLFLQSWPKEFVRRVLDPAYEPTRQEFLEDYLLDNASRNRAFDLLPLLAHLDEERVAKEVGTPVGARPAVHYRLANSRVGDPAWRLFDEWERWLRVERLADERDLLQDLCVRLRRRLEKLVGALDGWSEEVRSCLA